MILEDLLPETKIPIALLFPTSISPFVEVTVVLLFLVFEKIPILLSPNFIFPP